MKMDDDLAKYLMHSFATELYYHLGWSRAQGALRSVGQGLVEKMVKDKEVELPYNDLEGILINLVEVMTKKYGVANNMEFEIAEELDLAKAAIMLPYRISVENCIFQDMHLLLQEYGIRRDWRRTPTGQNGMFLLCPLMNMLTHAIDNNSDFLAGHCLEATKQEGNICICLIDVFSREIDISGFPEDKNPELYRQK